MVGSYCPYVSGPVLVKVNLRDGNGFQNVGYTADGVQIEHQLFTNPVHSDQYGGTAGPPVDRQFMGVSARISLSLVTFSMTVIKRMIDVQQSTNWTTDVSGKLNDIGGFLTCGNRAIQVLLVGAADTAAVVADAAAKVITNLNYPNCWHSGPIRLPISSKNSVFEFDLEAHPFTTDTVQSGDGETYLYLENTHVVTNMATYAGSTQSP